MAERPSELAWTAEGVVARVRLRGSAVLASPMLNRGTAFTAAEREALGLTGLLPEAVTTMQGELARVYGQYRRQPDDLAKAKTEANLDGKYLLRSCDPDLAAEDITLGYKQLLEVDAALSIEPPKKIISLAPAPPVP